MTSRVLTPLVFFNDTILYRQQASENAVFDSLLDAPRSRFTGQAGARELIPVN
ncbi:MAG: hypothetical protein GXP09_10555 [Gammaproteobacteria bacterium]|nr:hypothetical protein [Gammaproteobacteria bacterium]